MNLQRKGIQSINTSYILPKIGILNYEWTTFWYLNAIYLWWCFDPPTNKRSSHQEILLWVYLWVWFSMDLTEKERSTLTMFRIMLWTRILEWIERSKLLSNSNHLFWLSGWRDNTCNPLMLLILCILTMMHSTF